MRRMVRRLVEKRKLVPLYQPFWRNGPSAGFPLDGCPDPDRGGLVTPYRRGGRVTVYFDQPENRWRWQRSALWQTCEDLYTQSYVGRTWSRCSKTPGRACCCRANVTQRHEVLADNDAEREYTEQGAWEAGGAGFAHRRQVYLTGENPFREGYDASDPERHAPSVG